ncbi:MULTISPECIES: DUF4232 domain-containing protein [Streptomyces]|uniref:DUF4232 domain-containing protein n=1 Tax=Streptomyces TaxID=1883 RepID=UPI0003A0F06F|nr:MULTISPECIES: DUF4232 domain-containing protein [Streptomyces]MBZ6108055.1 DUF4232 domain-containing protein [Streptomyces olivaceus]MBZ6121939.1 DUF4232 domain-containing protein [Streptomyces olivaceus]MBZ6142760.1 DUF4232 domain-containing protein [Streptomyces olivaceus]MBZ6156600.1 DUF4232 domain-containing protein [Streptomyces olivaceus]MBZ6184396.1 DUF4232 domain-containing protein [Streptomyces olivaceus]
MSARTTRTRLFAAATVALAALSLTACEGDGLNTGSPKPASSSASADESTGPSDDAKDDTGSAGSSGSAGKDDASGSGTGSGSGEGSGSGKNTGGDKDSNSGSGSDSDSDLPGKCSASDVRITAKNAPRPINHLLLTATNTGSKTCTLPQYPAARFGEAQSVPPVAESSKPQALTTLASGESGYAGVRLSSGDGSAEGGHEVSTLTIPFEDGSIARAELPSGGVHVDNDLTVTYWQTSAANALEY